MINSRSSILPVRYAGRINRRYTVRSAPKFIDKNENISMPTPLSVGFNLMYQPVKKTPNNHDDVTTVAIVTGWMGAKQKQLKPYLTFYHDKGINTLSFAIGPKQVLFPQSASDQMETVLNEIIKLEAKEAKENRSLKILFHNFSVGGFLFGQMLRRMESHPEKYGKLKSIIVAQVFDSPPDFNGIATGVSKRYLH